MAMGSVSARLCKRFLAEKERKVIPFSELVQTKKLVSTLKKTIKTPQDLKGYDPVHALYIVVQNMVSLFAEQVSNLPEMKKYYRIMDKAERVYMPEGPPISPLTRSYFTHWAFFDAQQSLKLLTRRYLNSGQGNNSLQKWLIYHERLIS
jgi:hypothetical protein